MRVKSAKISTLYAGGGTPTILPPAFWERFLNLLGSEADTTSIAECTMETNPGTVTGYDLERLRRMGFNRLSIGVQSFHDETLTILGRIHDAQEAADSFGEARRAGFRDIAIDLIYGVPGQTMKMWREDLRRAGELKPEHISCYELTLEEGTPMWELVRSGQLSKPDEDTCADMYYKADEFLTSREYVHYEVSNYSRGNHHTSVHNCGYWRRDPCIGLGPSAHSFDGASRRSWNLSSVERYIERLREGRPATSGSEELTKEQTATERIMLGLRCCGGFDLEALQRETGIIIDRDYLNIMVQYGRVVEIDSRIVPTAAGKLFADGDALNLITAPVNPFD